MRSNVEDGNKGRNSKRKFNKQKPEAKNEGSGSNTDENNGEKENPSSHG